MEIFFPLQIHNLFVCSICDTVNIVGKNNFIQQGNNKLCVHRLRH